jgi:hypothetical protein
MSLSYPGGIISSTENVPTTSPPYCGGVWKLSEAAYWAGQGQWPYGPSDPNFEYNTLLLNGYGTNGAQNNTFLDSSTNNFTITRNGNTTQGSFSPYGSLWSNYIPSGSYFTAPDNSAFDFGAGDFTIEGWTNFTSTSGTQNIVCRNYGASTGFILSNVNFLAAISSAWDINITFSSGFTANTWQHFAVVRNGNVFTCYINGNSVGTQTISGTIANSSGDVQIGRRNGQSGFAGYMSNLRIVKGTAVYTTTFTPPTVPLTAISGTSILTCQANRFIDSSSNNFTITVNGSPQVQRFSPFNPTAPYSTSVIGGSGYFDGSGDYLTVPNNAALQLGSSDFTIGAWVYVTATSGLAQTLIAKGTGAGNQASYVIQLNSSGTWVYNLSSNGSAWYVSDVPIGTNTLNTWQYIALVRSGNTFTPYLNGVAGTATTASITLFAGTAVLSLGSDDTGSLRLTGYISDARVVKGTAIVPSTNPTTPSTAVTNTSFLGNMTNAGIPDFAMINNLETVGDAQVNTSVVKYGTGSLKFDGTGDYLVSADKYSGTFGTGNFTVEMWLYPIAATNRTIMANRTGSTGTSNAWSFEFFNTAQRLEWHTGLAIVASSNTNITLNAWTHVAVVRSSGTLTIYQGGVSVASVSDSNNYSEANSLLIGYEPVFPSTNGAFYGYMDDIRITKGLARYTSAFTPPTAALPTY